jgi:hypothetical protein
MYNQQHHLKTNNISKLGVLTLSIVLLTGISLVPTLQIGVQGQVQQQQSPLAPPPPGTTSAPSRIPAPPSQGTIAPRQTISPPPPSSPPAAPETTTTRPPPSFGAVGGGAANQTGAADNQTAGGGAVNQSAVVMIPQSTIQMIMSQLQDAMTAVDSKNEVEATTALNSVAQELKSAANASGISIEIQ